jgi:hypothetical protein
MTTTSSPPAYPRTNEGIRICQVIEVKPDALDEYKKVCLSPRLRVECRRAHVTTESTNNLVSFRDVGTSETQIHAQVWPSVLNALRRARIFGAWPVSILFTAIPKPSTHSIDTGV